MLPRVSAAEYVRPVTLLLRFSDGVSGEVDLSAELHGEIFLPRRDDGYFRQFKLDPTVRTVVWPNGADFAPEFLYQQLKVLT